jgi:hypothetical protein
MPAQGSALLITYGNSLTPNIHHRRNGMMNGDDMQREGSSGYFPRRPLRGGQYPDKRPPNYSPSSNFNYGYNDGGRPQHGGDQQHPRRRVDRFRREQFNQSDRAVRQNDLIIRLLKEIRDRLPPPPNAPTSYTPATDAEINSTAAPDSAMETDALGPDAQAEGNKDQQI